MKFSFMVLSMLALSACKTSNPTSSASSTDSSSVVGYIVKLKLVGDDCKIVDTQKVTSTQPLPMVDDPDNSAEQCQSIVEDKLSELAPGKALKAPTVVKIETISQGAASGKLVSLEIRFKNAPPTSSLTYGYYVNLKLVGDDCKIIDTKRIASNKPLPMVDDPDNSAEKCQGIVEDKLLELAPSDAFKAPVVVKFERLSEGGKSGALIGLEVRFSGY